MKQTKKFVAGYARLREIDNQRGRPRSYTNKELYRLLEEKKQVWDSKQGSWGDRTEPRSMFGDDEPSGVIRLRVMAHPEDVQKAVQRIQQSNLKVIEISDEYLNRRGSGVRVYITATFK